MSEAKDEIIIRHYRPEDREVVRRICCDTGFLGNPVDPVFQDRELFADYLTGYYLDEAPELAVILEKNGEVRGYILCGNDPQAQAAYERSHAPGWAWRAITGYFFRYGAGTKKYIHWILTKGRKEVPFTPKGMAHFHINLLSDVRSMDGTRKMFDFFFHDLKQKGIHSIYGQVVTFEERRSAAMFKRYGFLLQDKMEVTKFQHMVDHSVFLFTVTKDLTHFTGMYDYKSEVKSDEVRTKK
ncbi:MAG: GNAT family acetyltransferase [Verrucomicrobiota bacterium]